MKYHHHNFQALGSKNEFVLYGTNASMATELFLLAEDEVRRIERKYSRYRVDSIVSQINEAAGNEAVAIDTETNNLLDFADGCYKQSAGLFDITSGVLRRVWDFKRGKIPNKEELARVCSLIGWNTVERDHFSIKLPKKGMEIDFGGIGKEYAVDQAITILENNGATSGYVNLGGDLRVIGLPPDRDSWTFGITHPRKPDKMIASVAITSGALATSGDYERFFIHQGIRYCHILNPRSGMPVNELQSATVLAPAALIAGSCSTIAMLFEGTKSIRFLKSLGFPFLVVNQSGKLESSGIKH